MIKSAVNLESIVPTTAQINILYSLLELRKYTISHEKMPSLREHTDFVKGHPYRVWYLIYVDGAVRGSLYVHFDTNLL